MELFQVVFVFFTIAITLRAAIPITCFLERFPTTEQIVFPRIVRLLVKEVVGLPVLKSVDTILKIGFLQKLAGVKKMVCPNLPTKRLKKLEIPIASDL